MGTDEGVDTENSADLDLIHLNPFEYAHDDNYKFNKNSTVKNMRLKNIASLDFLIN